MSVRRRFHRVLLVATGLLIGTVAGGGDAPFSPRNPPLAVVRTTAPATVTDLLDSTWAKALSLSHHRAVREVADLCQRLAAAGAGDLWLAVSGTSIMSPSWIAGCTLPDATDLDGLEEAVAAAFPTLQFARHPAGVDGHWIWLAATDAAELRDLSAPAARREEGWRKDLTAFLATPGHGIEVWLNPRPLTGILSLLAGIDARAEAARYGLTLPEAIHLSLFPGDAGTVSFRAEVPGIVADGPPLAPASRPVPAYRAQPLAEITVTDPRRVLRQLAVPDDCLAFANLSLRRLVPDSATLALWRLPDGGLTWSVTCLYPDATAFLPQFQRVAAWLEILSTSTPTGAGPQPPDTAWRSFRLGTVTGILGVLPTDNGPTIAVIAGDTTVVPTAETIRIRDAEPASLLTWSVGPDHPMVQAVAGSPVFSRNGLGAGDPSSWFEVLRNGDAGRLAVEDGGATVILETGAAVPMVAAALA
ncbi:MAG: hypothetical protein LIP77_08150, partial [Planctomycetes bacterium]|nr:hypothetical protein [Planctomycetota bacterium]